MAKGKKLDPIISEFETEEQAESTTVGSVLGCKPRLTIRGRAFRMTRRCGK